MITPRAIILPRRQPGGAIILHEHLVFGSGEGSKGTVELLHNAMQGFLGKFNRHMHAAREMMKDLGVATVWIGVDNVLELL